MSDMGSSSDFRAWGPRLYGTGSVGQLCLQNGDCLESRGISDECVYCMGVLTPHIVAVMQ